MSHSAVFPCNQCGLCCRLVYLSAETAWLDRGDGTCRHFDTETNLCTIYEERPLVCRVRDYYKAKLADQHTWEEFIEINLKTCHHLQKAQENNCFPSKNK